MAETERRISLAVAGRFLGLFGAAHPGNRNRLAEAPPA